MKKTNQARAASLCAVIVAMAMLLAVMPPVPAAAAEAAGEAGTTEAKEYKYAVTIEFGSMTFCYDYGTWDVHEMCYKANASSAHPANGTVQGYPGWYGFDGTANCITVKYTNGNQNDSDQQKRWLAVSLEYQALPDLSNDALRVVDGVEMEFYADSALTQKHSQNSFLIPHTDLGSEEKTIIYASLRGEPRDENFKFSSTTFSPIGTLTIRIGNISN